MIKLNRFGAYAVEGFWMVPYQHFSNKSLWVVKCCNYDAEKEYKVIATTPLDASNRALNLFRQHLRRLSIQAEEVPAIRMLRRMVAKHDKEPSEDVIEE